MISISKSAEPQSLTQHRANVAEDFQPDYSNYREKDDLRKSLVNEQFAICCYCMGRIKEPKEGSMKIEHWQSQTVYPANQLEYKNLLGACTGGEGSPLHSQHCDTRKGNSELKYNPADASHMIENRVAYLSNGVVRSNEDEFDTQLNDVLNLNFHFLKSNRKSVLDAFKALLGSKSLSVAQWKKLLLEWEPTNGGKLRPYCGVIRYWIEKKIARNGK